MKFSLKKILGNKYIPFLLLGVIFLGIVFFIGIYKIKEGFDSSIGEYEYLAPIPPNTTWSQDTQTAFRTAYNKQSPGFPLSSNELDNFMKYATEEEAKYFIANGKYPWGSYITNAYLKFPNVTQKTIDGFQKSWPTRVLYEYRLLPTESKETPPPLSYQIYMGTAQPPTASSSGSSSSSSTDSSSSQPSVLSNSDYQSLTSICKNILGQN